MKTYSINLKCFNLQECPIQCQVLNHNSAPLFPSFVQAKVIFETLQPVETNQSFFAFVFEMAIRRTDKELQFPGLDPIETKVFLQNILFLPNFAETKFFWTHFLPSLFPSTVYTYHLMLNPTY